MTTTDLCAGTAALLAAASLSLTASGRQPPASKLPGELGDYVVSQARLAPADQERLLRGEPVTKILDADPSKEVAIFGAVWIKAPVARYVSAVKDIEQFEKGGNFVVTKRISNPPRLDDFAQLTLPPDDVGDLKSCKVGSCDLKLGEAAMVRMRKEVDWSKPTAGADVDRLARQLTLEYVNGYLEGGDKELATYRDSSRPTFVAQEFSTMVGHMPALTVYLPELKRYLLDYPKVTLPNSDSFLYWQEANFGLKPTIRINHFTVVEQPPNVAVVSKMLYATHYFWTAIELRVLVPDASRGEGFWFASVSQSRSDGLSGFTGSLIRGKVRGEAEKGMLAVLRTMKARLEKS
jgi:hypothetical protein